MSNQITTAPAGGALTARADVMDELAAAAKGAAAAERPATSRISLKSGVLSYAGQPMPGNKAEVLVLAATYRNTYYAGRYDANNIVNPNCFALSDTDAGMTPHPNVAEPEHPTCEGCPRNEWGSDPNGGRGKACKQTRRLVLMPASAITDKTDDVKSAELAIMDVPVTSVKNYSAFVNTLAATVGVPPYAAVCEVSVVPDAKTQFKVKFQPMRTLPTVEHLRAVQSRLEGAIALGVQPYDSSATKDDAEEEVKQAAKPAPKAKKF